MRRAARALQCAMVAAGTARFSPRTSNVQAARGIHRRTSHSLLARAGSFSISRGRGYDRLRELDIDQRVDHLIQIGARLDELLLRENRCGRPQRIDLFGTRLRMAEVIAA